MRVAVVFDSAGTLLRTYRIAKEVLTGKMLENIETTMLTFADPDRVLCVLHGHSRDYIQAPPEMLISDYIREQGIEFGISCTRKVVEKETIQAILHSDSRAVIRDMQECMRIIWKEIKDREVVALNNGLIVHTGHNSIEFCVATGGTPFPGARETIRTLHHMGIFTYIASGDREAKLERMADYLGIPRDQVFGVATPAIKERIVRDLQHDYDLVAMVGDSVNDLRAMRTADIAILSDQQQSEKPEELISEADYRIHDLQAVPKILQTVLEKS
ncbi:MAG TPA: HAD family hydrolase [Methanospirillum sp.]|nr:HAD family hydrolase [Methanospirillum sp.]HOL42129.1 HAD family hydrolase [Methanospirillum sp.]HPP77057.1 HAD family hydrolase [Methanospirillum sp.]